MNNVFPINRGSLANSPLVMTSKEIADLLELRHDNVKRAIERLASREVISEPTQTEIRYNHNNTAPGYILEKRDTYVVVAQLSPELTGRLVDRWQELEASVQTGTVNVRDLSISESYQLMQNLIELEGGQLRELVESCVETKVAELLQGYSLATPVTENPDELLNPSQLGFISRVSPQRMNRILIDLNFQVKDELGYRPTRQAEGLYEIISRSRTRSGRVVSKFRWKRCVLQSIPARYLS